MRTNKLYLTDCNPNGTNDLIVIDSNYNIVASLDEVTFGYTKPEFTNSIGPQGIIDDASALLDSELLESGYIGLYEVTLNEIYKYICVSPIDPYGNNIVNKIMQLMTEVNQIDQLKGIVI